MYCKACGEDLKRVMLLALMIDMGCKTSSDPNRCHETQDSKHIWIEEEKKVEEDLCHLK